MADINTVNEEAQGQAQAAVAEPHDGTVIVRETRVATDEVILDANADNAVQIPEEAGTVQDRLALPAEALNAPSPEEAFAKAKPKK